MADKALNPKMEEELRSLALLPDEAIDLSDVPEAIDWSTARRAAFYEGMLAERKYDVRAIANWFLDRLAQLRIEASNLSLNKLLYFAIERALVEQGVLLTPAKIEAWEHGPVFREVYHGFKFHGERPIETRASKFSPAEKKMVPATEAFRQDDVEFFEDIVQSYGRLSAGRLRNISHCLGGPWDAVWGRTGTTNPGMEISARCILRRAPQRRPVNGRP